MVAQAAVRARQRRPADLRHPPARLASCSGGAALALTTLALAPADSGMAPVLGVAAAALAIAFADVVVDAHMVEVARSRGL